MTHTIFYAYPTSDFAEQAGGHGFVVTYIDPETIGHANDGITLRRFDSYSDALAFASTLGTEPDRWSIDHPKNASLLDEAKRAAHHNRNWVEA